MVLVVLLVLGAIGLLAYSSVQGNKAAAVRRAIAAVPDFSGSIERVDQGGSSYLVLDEARQKICIAAPGNPPKVLILPASDVLEAVVVEDGAVTSTNRGSQAAGAIVGGLLLGPVGLLAGALTGKRETKRRVERVELRLLVRHVSYPLHLFSFMPLPSMTTEDMYKRARADADLWRARVIALAAQPSAPGGTEHPRPL